MSNHPNRSNGNPREDANPTPEMIRDARERAGHSIEFAAAMIFESRAKWEAYERPKDHPDHRRMHPGLFELYQIKTGLIQIVLKDDGASIAVDAPVSVTAHHAAKQPTWHEPTGEVEWWSGFYGFALHAIRGDGRWVRESGEKAGNVRAVCGIVVPSDFRRPTEHVLNRCRNCEQAIVGGVDHRNS